MSARTTIAGNLRPLLAGLALLLGLAALGSAGYALALTHRVGVALRVGVAESAAEASKDGKPDASKNKGDEKKKTELSEETEKLLAEHPVFGSKPQQQPNLEGILGDSALISGQWVKLGEQQGSAKLLEINPFGVVIEWDGERRELSMWNDLAGSEARAPSRPRTPPPPPGAEGPAPRPTTEGNGVSGAVAPATPDAHEAAPGMQPAPAPATIQIGEGGQISQEDYQRTIDEIDGRSYGQ
jgi:hypothetical protein